MIRFGPLIPTPHGLPLSWVLTSPLQLGETLIWPNVYALGYLISAAFRLTGDCPTLYRQVASARRSKGYTASCPYFAPPCFELCPRLALHGVGWPWIYTLGYC